MEWNEMGVCEWCIRTFMDPTCWLSFVLHVRIGAQLLVLPGHMQGFHAGIFIAKLERLGVQVMMVERVGGRPV